MTDAQYEQQAEKMRQAGREHGRSAASWYFDGNTSEETYRRVLRGIEEGDPEILDSLPSAPLSGEWADDPTPDSVLADVLGDDFDNTAEWPYRDDLLTAYEDGFSEAVHDSIEGTCRYMLDVSGTIRDDNGNTVGDFRAT